MIDLKPALLSALADLPACADVSFAREEFSLPIIVIGDEDGRVCAQADGAPYLCVYTRALPGHLQADLRRCSR